ncbi:MAG: VOC family protein [Pseudomonadota bacterium]
MPRLYRSIILVSDIEQAQAFYSTVLGMPGKRVSPERHYFDCEGTILACFDSMKFNEKPATPNPDYVYIAVDDLNESYALCKQAGATITEEIQSHPWGETSFYIEDPFGNPMCFVDRTTVFMG